MTRSIEKQNGKTFCEFFAGIGLVRMGLESSGWSCVYANDNDPKKREQYVANFGEDDFHLCDVFETNEIVRRLPADVCLATASFPCVDLSLAGHWKGIEGAHSSAVFGFLNCISSIKSPPLILLENVVGLLTSKGGKDFEKLVCLLAEAGYWLDAFRLDARYFVPQSRPRIFIVGVHESEIAACPFPKSTDEFCLGSENFDSRLERSVNLRPARLAELIRKVELQTGWFCSVAVEPKHSTVSLAALIDVDETQAWWDDTQVEKHYKMMNDNHRVRVDDLLSSGEQFIGTIYRRKRDGTTRAEVRFDGTAGCLRTPKGGSARQIVIVINNHKLHMRWMSPKEYARLQGAGNFRLVGGINQQLFGFGDAVCVPAIRWIGDNVLNPLFQSSSRATIERTAAL